MLKPTKNQVLRFLRYVSDLEYVSKQVDNAELMLADPTSLDIDAKDLEAVITYLIGEQ